MLKNPQKADLDKDGKLSSYEKKRGKAIEDNMKAKRGKFFEEKKEKIDLGEIVGKALKDSSNKQMSDKSASKYIKRKTREQIREREMVKKSMGGKIMKAKTGKDIKIIEAVAKEPIIGKGRLKKEVKKKSMGGEMKGYGAARTSGMGLQDEQLVPGKSLDYYKDIM